MSHFLPSSQASASCTSIGDHGLGKSALEILLDFAHLKNHMNIFKLRVKHIGEKKLFNSFIE